MTGIVSDSTRVMVEAGLAHGSEQCRGFTKRPVAVALIEQAVEVGYSFEV